MVADRSADGALDTRIAGSPVTALTISSYDLLQEDVFSKTPSVSSVQDEASRRPEGLLLFHI